MRNNAFSYGASSSASVNPEEFMVQALQKCILNNKLIVKFVEAKNDNEVRKRAINTIKLLEEMDLRLNREEENEVVDRVSLLFEWLIEENDEVMEKWQENEEHYLKKLEDTNPTLENLLSSFKTLGGL